MPGKDELLFILGVKSFVREDVLRPKDFSIGDSPKARIAAFSISELAVRNLKLNFGRRLFRDDLPLKGLADSLNRGYLGLGAGEKFTLLGVRFGVWGMFILTKSSLQFSFVLEGISKARLCLCRCWSVGDSSIISLDSTTYITRHELEKYTDPNENSLLNINHEFPIWKALFFLNINVKITFFLGDEPLHSRATNWPPPWSVDLQALKHTTTPTSRYILDTNTREESNPVIFQAMGSPLPLKLTRGWYVKSTLKP